MTRRPPREPHATALAQRDELARQGARPAADVERALAGGDPAERASLGARDAEERP
jgi:hypothetical protein